MRMTNSVSAVNTPGSEILTQKVPAGVLAALSCDARPAEVVTLDETAHPKPFGTPSPITSRDVVAGPILAVAVLANVTDTGPLAATVKE